MKYSILFTAYDPEGKLAEMTKASLQSIIQNSVGRDYELIIDNEPGGVFSAYNRLFKKAQGEYLVVVPNDTIIESPDWLEQLALPDYITSWHIGRFFLTGNLEPDGGVTCYPRKLADMVGEYDTQFDGGYGYGDNDWFHRATLLGIQYVEAPVKIKHKGLSTWEAYWPKEQLEAMKRNELLFKKKWNL